MKKLGKLFFALLITSSIPTFSQEIKVTVDSRLYISDIIKVPGGISTWVEGDVREMSTGNLVVPTQNTVITITPQGELLNYHVDGAVMPPNFQAGATELPNGNFLIGGLKGLYHFNSEGEFINAISYLAASMTGSMIVDAYPYQWDRYIVPTRSRKHYSPSGWQGRIYVLDPDFKVVSSIIIPDSHFSSGHPIKLKDENFAIVSSTSLIIFDPSKGILKETKLAPVKYLKSTNATPTELDSGNIVVGMDENLHYLSSAGELLNTVPVEGEILKTIMKLDNGLIVFSTNHGLVYFFDDEGNEVSKTRISERAIGSEATQLKNGLVVVGGDTGKLFFFNNEGKVVAVNSELNAGSLRRQKVLELQDGRILVHGYKYSDTELVFLNVSVE